MHLPGIAAPIDLDVTTLFVVATCITALLGIVALVGLVAGARARVGLVGQRLI